MLQNTKGIVLRTIKYGDTSIVVTIYTELFGLQSYLVNGVRTERKSGSKANIYQPTTLLDLVAYHSPNKNLQRIKEARVNYIYRDLQQDIIKNTLAIYITELITRTITEPEANPELFAFFESSYHTIDQRGDTELSNFAIQFTLQLAAHLGFGLYNSYSDANPVLDLQYGEFCSKQSLRSLHFVEGEQAMAISALADETQTVPNLNQQKRNELLFLCLHYLRIHVPHLGELKSVEVLHEVLR